MSFLVSDPFVLIIRRMSARRTVPLTELVVAYELRLQIAAFWHASPLTFVVRALLRTWGLEAGILKSHP